MSNKIIINGKTYEVSGSNVSIANGKIYVNNELLVTDKFEKEITIVWEGDLASLKCNNSIIKGSVKGDIDCNSITVENNVEGNIDANTVQIKGNVTGDVDGNDVKILGSHYGDLSL